MKHIEIPADIIFVNSDGTVSDDPYSWKDWMLGRIMRDESIGKMPYKLLCLAQDIKSDIKAANGVLRVNDIAWDFVCALINKQSNPFHTHFQLQLIPFMKSWIDASEIDPKDSKEEVK